MKLFDDRTTSKRTLIREAQEHAAGGELALHVWQPLPEGSPGAPSVFRSAAHRGQPWGHLLGHNRTLLVEVAKQLGVRVVVIHGKGPCVHVDLCGGPLRKAIKLCSEPSLF